MESRGTAGEQKARNPLKIEIFGNGRDLPGPHFENSIPVGATTWAPFLRGFFFVLDTAGAKRVQ